MERFVDWFLEVVGFFNGSRKRNPFYVIKLAVACPFDINFHTLVELEEKPLVGLAQSVLLGISDCCWVGVGEPHGVGNNRLKVRFSKPNFFLEFPPEGSLNRFACIDATLLELPNTNRVLRASEEGNLVTVIVNHRADAGAEVPLFHRMTLYHSAVLIGNEK